MNNGIDSNQVWHSVCGELGVAMSEASFSSWIKPCFIENVSDIDENRILVELATPSSFHQKTIDERYYGQIKRVIEKQTNKQCELAIIVRQRENGGAEEATTTTEVKPDLFNQAAVNRDLEEKLGRSGLNQRFTFENFVVGGSNNLAYAAARSVADNPGTRHNPMFIWGGVGVGKTHLMHAIGRALVEKNKTVCLLTSEQFTNEFIATVRDKTVDSFKKKYRNVDALMIDDIQFIAGKESTQEEFFHTFNELYTKGRQIVMTSDRRPQDIQQVEQRLISRFLGGLTVDIGLPDFEMRMAILSQKCQELEAEVEQGALDLIATSVNTNTRELEGLLMRLLSMAAINGTALTKEIVERELGVKVKKLDKKLRPQEVISLIAKEFEFKNKDIVGKSRKADVVLARHIAMYILREEMGLQLQRVAQLMGDRDHTTVMHAVEKVGREFGVNQSMREQIMKVKQALYT